MASDGPKLLNVGCGRRFHSAWRNVDLVSNDPGVMEHDLRTGIPFDDGCFDAVYHSHVLEHMPPEDGRKLLEECFRVLSASGVVRIAVPDLEGIARAYLDAVDRCDQSQPGAEEDHAWMQLELIDQMVRPYSGGQMGAFMADQNIPNKDFIASRMGAEILNCIEPETGDDHPQTAKAASKPPTRSLAKKLKDRVRRVRKKAERSLLKRLYGKDIFELLDIARFRASGEIHQWMYDRISLQRLLVEVGFVNVSVRSASESQIPSFAEYELDEKDGQVCKPDSLFIEAVKPASAMIRAA